MMTLPTLPIPDLQETTTRYLAWVRPLLDDAAYKQTQAKVADFVAGIGSTLQQDLQDFAKTQAEQGDSWLSEAWLHGYLAERRSLPLSTSGAFRLDLHLPDSGLRRLAHLIAGLAKQSADYLNGCLEPNVSARGEALDMRQWLALRGISRVPRPDCDDFALAPLTPQQRVIIVFWQGAAFPIVVLDAEHRPVSVDAISQALHELVSVDSETAPLTPASLSVAPAEQAASHYRALQAASPQNGRNMTMLEHSLFHIHLSPQAFADDAEALRDLTFLVRTRFWAYKPLTICANLENDNYFGYLEHSSYDAGALQAILARAEASAVAGIDGTVDSQALPEPLVWTIPAAQQQALATIEQQHQQQADNCQVAITTTVLPAHHRPAKTSADALMQLPIQYAQYQTFGCIRNTYESVDISHFQAGRTECLRPVSVESVAFVTALANGSATWEDFQAAHTEHKNRIKACKSGHGVNRHLLGLQLMAQRRGIEADFFSDSAYQCLTSDFLSTSSLGNRRWIGDFSFMPTIAGGLGISYFLTDDNDGFLYCISFHRQQTAEVKKFMAALQEGCQRLGAVIKP